MALTSHRISQGRKTFCYLRVIAYTIVTERDFMPHAASLSGMAHSGTRCFECRELTENTEVKL